MTLQVIKMTSCQWENKSEEEKIDYVKNRLFIRGNENRINEITVGLDNHTLSLETCRLDLLGYLFVIISLYLSGEFST